MKIGIVGYGKMGQSIFKLIAGSNHHVTVVETTPDLAERIEKKFFKKIERSLKRSGLSGENLNTEVEKARGRFCFTHHFSALADAELVIESVFENTETKIDVFRRLEHNVKEDAALLTNTSSISIDLICESLDHPERCCGFHFFHPVMLINLVEIIQGQSTSDLLVKELRRFAESLGKKPVVVKDGPGSVINGILTYYYAEAAYLLEEGWASPSEIDSAAGKYFYVGPCESIDVIGMDLFLDALENAPAPGTPSIVPIRIVHPGQKHLSNQELGGREGFYFPPLLQKLFDDNRLGKKVSTGIYVYKNGKAVNDAPDYYINPLISCPEPTDNKEDMIAMRLLYSIFNGTLWALHHDMGSEDDLDIGVREILQMARGPIAMMKKMGFSKVKADFDLLFESVGQRFHAPALPRLFAQ